MAYCGQWFGGVVCQKHLKGLSSPKCMMQHCRHSGCHLLCPLDTKGLQSPIVIDVTTLSFLSYLLSRAVSDMVSYIIRAVSVLLCPRLNLSAECSSSLYCAITPLETGLPISLSSIWWRACNPCISVNFYSASDAQKADYCIDNSVVWVCLSCGRAVPKWLKRSRSCLRWRFLGIQGSKM